MADDNNIKLGLEIEKDGVVKGFDFVDDRAVKSAKASAIAFEEAFQNQEQKVKDSINAFAKLSENLTTKSAKESAQAFDEIFKQQAKQAKASADAALKAVYDPTLISKSAKESADVFAENFNQTLDGRSFGAQLGRGLSSMAFDVKDLAASWYLVKEAVDLVARATRATIQIIKDGEAEFKLDTRFKAFAENAGLAADTLKAGLSAATGGFVGESEQLRIANEAIIALGKNASRLPEVFTLARKTYSVFGGDVVGNANAIVDAVSTLNTRQLRQQGININAEKAVADYARTLGTLPKFLTDAQKQTAVLNAILELQNTRFKDVEVSAGKASDAFAKTSVALSEAYDDLAKIVALKFGETFKDGAEGIASFTESLRKQAEYSTLSESTTEGLTRKVEILQKTTDAFAKEWENKSFFERVFDASRLNIQNERLEELEKLKQKLKEVNAEATKQVGAGSAPTATPSGDSGGGGDAGVNEAILNARRDLSAKVLDIQRAQFDAERALAEKKFQQDATMANLATAQLFAYEAEKQRAMQQTADAEKFMRENGINDELAKNTIKESIERQHKANMEAIDLEFREREKQTLDKNLMDVTSMADAWTQVLAGMKTQTLTTIRTMSQLFVDLGKTASSVFKTQISNAIFAMAQGMQTGEDAAQMLFTTMLNSMAQLLIGEGTGWVLVGAARTWAGDPTGPALIGAGAAMTGFGAILASISAANGGAMQVGAAASTAGASAGGGSTSSVTSPTTTGENVTPPSEGEARTPTTQVAVNINGNVFDRRETGLEIAKILEEQFSSQGLKVVGV